MIVFIKLIDINGEGTVVMRAKGEEKFPAGVWSVRMWHLLDEVPLVECSIADGRTQRNCDPLTVVRSWNDAGSWGRRSKLSADFTSCEEAAGNVRSFWVSVRTYYFKQASPRPTNR